MAQGIRQREKRKCMSPPGTFCKICFSFSLSLPLSILHFVPNKSKSIKNHVIPVKK